MSALNPQVSVVIPCFNQGHFLTDAIQSVLDQEGVSTELIVVNDGSCDSTSEVASSYPLVQLINQQNGGLSAARNKGLASSRGSLVVFLDADDWLLPGALSAGIESLKVNPDCAFVYGRLRLVSDSRKMIREPDQVRLQEGHYKRLLAGNFITNPGVVMYRRPALERVGGFTGAPDIDGCQDYDIYMRIAATSRITHHEQFVLDYRKHAKAMSANFAHMFRCTMSVLDAQWPAVKGHADLAEACLAGMEHYRKYYGEKVVSESIAHLQAGHSADAASCISVLARFHPDGLERSLRSLIPSSALDRQ
jgi:glycosyltransferase involved in cell wall biosynthesis